MSSKILPAYLLIGDAFLCQEKFQSLLDSIKKQGTGEMAVWNYRLKETPLDRVLVEARALPFLAAFQVFRLREAGELKSKDCESLSDYLERPAPAACLIFETEELAQDHPLAKAVRKYGETVLLDAKQKKEAGNSFIKQKLRQLGKRLTPQAAAVLEERLGDAPSLLDSALEHLASLSGTREEIDESMVEQLDEKRQDVHVFQLANAIASRKTGEALTVLHRILQKDEGEIPSLVGFLHWQMKRFWQAQKMLGTGQPQETVLRRCKVYPKQAPFFLRQLRSFSKTKLEEALEGLFQLDWKMKTGQVDGMAGIEAWVIKVTS